MPLTPLTLAAPKVTSTTLSREKSAVSTTGSTPDDTPPPSAATIEPNPLKRKVSANPVLPVKCWIDLKLVTYSEPAAAVNERLLLSPPLTLLIFQKVSALRPIILLSSPPAPSISPLILPVADEKLKVSSSPPPIKFLKLIKRTPTTVPSLAPSATVPVKVKLDKLH